MKISQEIKTTLKDFGKKAKKKELRELIISKWQEGTVEKSESLSHEDIKRQFADALIELENSNKIRVFKEDGDTYVEYVRKNKRNELESVTSCSQSLKNSTELEQSNVDEQIKADIPRAKKEKLECIPSQPQPVTAPDGPNTILLFYAYCNPAMTSGQQDKAIAHFYGYLKSIGITGRLRIGREGYNCTLTGRSDAIREFTKELKRYDPATFSNTDFKYVDGQPDNQLLPQLKVFPVSEIVTYGFDAKDAPLDMRGTHLTPHEFHKALENPNSVVIDVRNFNEALIGKFQPPENAPHQKYLDPKMRRSTEFPEWVEDNKPLFEGKQVLMYCTAGVRCERASAFMRNKGIQNVFQLEGGIHRYLDAFPEDGGYWKGKNYVFDKRYSHGAKQSEVISFCVYCDEPWERYNAQQTCFKCKMEVLLCKTCMRRKPAVKKSDLFCPLCLPRDTKREEKNKNTEKDS